VPAFSPSTSKTVYAFVCSLTHGLLVLTLKPFPSSQFLFCAPSHDQMLSKSCQIQSSQNFFSIVPASPAVLMRLSLYALSRTKIICNGLPSTSLPPLIADVLSLRCQSPPVRSILPKLPSIFTRDVSPPSSQNFFPSTPPPYPRSRLILRPPLPEGIRLPTFTPLFPASKRHHQSHPCFFPARPAYLSPSPGNNLFTPQSYRDE